MNEIKTAIEKSVIDAFEVLVQDLDVKTAEKVRRNAQQIASQMAIDYVRNLTARADSAQDDGQDLTIAYMKGFADGKRASNLQAGEPVAYGDRIGTYHASVHLAPKGELPTWMRQMIPLYTAPPSQQAGKDACTWRLTDEDQAIWESDCGQAWTFIDGGPVDNGVKFCHGCGEPMIVGQQSDEKEGAE